MDGIIEGVAALVAAVLEAAAGILVGLVELTLNICIWVISAFWPEKKKGQPLSERQRLIFKRMLMALFTLGGVACLLALCWPRPPATPRKQAREKVEEYLINYLVEKMRSQDEKRNN
jgi:hypothetical protein